MGKRRRASSLTRSVDGDDDSSSHTSETPTMQTRPKRKKMDPADIMQQTYDVIRNFKKEDGTLLCDPFIRIPKKRQEPSYYEVVANPIDFIKIQQKLKTDEYDDINDLQTDVELIVKNAKTFYKRNSQEYKDAQELLELFVTTKNKLLNPQSHEGTPEPKGRIVLKVNRNKRETTPLASTSSGKRSLDLSETEDSRDSYMTDDELAHCEDLFAAVMTSTDAENRLLYHVFQLLPSKKRYPEYYDVIDEPIDLRTIARKIQDGKYSCLGDMEKDLILMTKNACTFNEPGSQIYKDAKTLKKIVQTKKLEIEQGKNMVGKSERIRNKRVKGSQTMSAITAALEDEEDESEEDLEIDLEDPNNPLWQVYESIRNARTTGSADLSEPFLKLPVKRYNPDYYRVIKNPRALLTIGKTLKEGQYNSLNELTGDLNIMFENAKKFNSSDTRIYKDAVKLQKIMQRKVQEVLAREGQNQYDDESGESDEEQPDAKVVRRQKLQQAAAMASSKSPKALTRGKYLDNIPLKRRLYALCKCLMDYRDQDGRQPMTMFMELPSAKIYPEYYKVIKHPIGMIQIENNIQSEKYRTQDEILADFRLMFANCREFNEPGSLIYEDAVSLEKILMDKMSELGPLPQPPEKKRVITKKVIKTTNVVPSVTTQKMRILFNTIKEHTEPKTGRQLSNIFQKIPSRHEYPDYYEVIKKPIDMEMISSKLRYNQYEHLDEMVADFIQMFDNACKYNEPDSHIYKDALSLQRIVLQTKMHLREDEDSVPDVPAAVQELLTSLFTSVYNHQDEEGRCFSDSMAELPEYDELGGKKIRAISLDLVKRRLDSGQYRRLDMFQEDLFACMDRARELSRTDSQVFEDSVEIQSYFIRQRDEICRNGDLLHSPALNYTLLDLSTAVDELRRQKLTKEVPEPQDAEFLQVESLPPPLPGQQTKTDQMKSEPKTEESENTEEDDEDEGGKEKKVPATPSVGVADNAMSYNQQIYRIGDFVYIEPREKGQEPCIVSIERLWTNTEGQPMMYGNQYFRPDETYHVATRKFLEKEVFKSDVHLTVSLKQILGRCAVVNVKDYFKFRPEGFEDKDVYVCESRYSSRSRSFKKFAKYFPPGHRWAAIVFNYKLVEREEPLEPNRVVSIFCERVEKHKQELTELEEREKFAEKAKPNILLPHPPLNMEPGYQYYEQFNSPTGMVIKTGDCVYVCTDPNNINAKPQICQVDKIWTDKNNNSFIQGPWILPPSDIVVPPGKIFFQKEVLLSSLEDTNPTTNIIGKCTVLEYSEYISCRPTEIPESEVYIVESMYSTVQKAIRELPPGGLKKYSHTAAVYQDEIYFFRRLLNPPKVGPTGLIVETPHHHHHHHHHTPHLASHHTPVSTPQHHPSTATPRPTPGPMPSTTQHQPSPEMFKEEKQPPTSTSSFQHHNFDSNSNSSSSQMQIKMETSSDILCEDSLDGPPPSVGSVESTPGAVTPITTPVTSKKVKSQKKALVTGYILYSGDVRKQVTSSNPERTFGEVSRIVGNEWRSLPANEKAVWEEKAALINQESAKYNALVEAHIAAQIEAGIIPPPVTPIKNFANHPDLVWECLWDNCDFQFEDMHDCIEHAVADGSSGGHVHQTFAAVPPHELEFQCQWRGCSRLKKPFPPFPSCARLARHVKEVHILKNPGKVVSSDNRSKNFVPRIIRSQPQPANGQKAGVGTNSNLMPPQRNSPSPSQSGSPHPGVPQRPAEPLFVTVPPRPQRLLHSDAYIKYIEGLTSENRNVGRWESQLRATQESTPVPEVTRLPSHWLANGPGQHGDVLSALWTLRDFMFRDALSVTKVL